MVAPSNHKLRNHTQFCGELGEQVRLVRNAFPFGIPPYQPKSLNEYCRPKEYIGAWV